MSDGDNTGIETSKQPINVSEALTTCFAPTAIAILILLGIVYLYTTTVENWDKIDAFLP